MLLEFYKKRNPMRSENRREAELEALGRAHREEEVRFFATQKYLGKVGAFEGASFHPTGYYRGELDCIMLTWGDAFCLVCRRAIERIIDLYSHP
jgi:hypothetical protein